ncbi:hypothetical protein OG230_28550 [Streptomyces sp. NBC_00234]|uniref:hypothetical protein n=1 Tax=Streptomyces sp. NBC_00234 TaxID=2903638 RepID=UPI002E2E7615|nr:hypothetical protein [Streptomyces sp. NBC_00234]
MRISRKTGLLVSTAACCALTLGSAGAQAMAAAESPANSTGILAAEPTIPGAEQLGAQAGLLKDTSGVLAPVTELIDAVLKAPDGKLPEAEATKLAAPVTDSLAPFKEKAATTLPAPDVATPGVAPGPQAEPDPGAVLKAEAAADLQAKVDALVKAAASGKPAEVAAAVQATITGSLNVVVSVVLGGGLPAPDLAGLPALPKIPGVPDVPVIGGLPL